VKWGESRNLKLLRAFLIGLPSLFLIIYFSRLDELDRAHGGSGMPAGWGVALIALILALTWLPAVPRPEALRFLRGAGFRQAWSWRLLRAGLVFGVVLLTVGTAWDVVANLSARDLGVGTQDNWAARALFAFLYALASVLFPVGPGDVLVGDLHPWSRAETRALARFFGSLAVGWVALTVPFLVFVAAQTGSWDIGYVVPFGLFFGTFLGLTIFASSGLVRPGPGRRAGG